MTAALLSLPLAGVQVPANDLAAPTPADRRRLHGQEVTVYVQVGAPLIAHDGVAYFGPGDRPDGSERSAVLVGEHHGFKIGVNVPAWVSVRATGTAVSPPRTP